MTVSTADFGGTGNGLGLPIANPLYGPANAAVMAQQAQQQNMLNAQATTQETQARTNRDVQTLPFDIQAKQATTAETQARTAAQDYQNKVNEAFGVTGGAAEKQATLEKMQMDNSSQRRTQEERALMVIAPRLDGMTSDQQDAAIADWFQKQGLPADHAKQWGDVVRSHNPNPVSVGPANAAQPQGGGKETAQTLFELQNPALAQAKLETASREKISTASLSTEEKIAKLKADTEKDVAEMGHLADPKQASQVFTNKYYELLKTDKTAAEEYRRQAIDAMNKQGFYDASANFARNAYGPMTPLLQDIAAKASGKQPLPQPQAAVGGQPANGTPVPPPIGGQSSVAQPPATPPAGGGPKVGDVLPGGAKIISVPQVQKSAYTPQPGEGIVPAARTNDAGGGIPSQPQIPVEQQIAQDPEAKAILQQAAQVAREQNASPPQVLQQHLQQLSQTPPRNPQEAQMIRQRITAIQRALKYMQAAQQQQQRNFY